MNRVRWSGLIAAALIASAVPTLNATGRAVPIEERARGAERVVVASVTETMSRYERNEFGDEMIVTYAHLTVEEALKGNHGPVTFAMEGGTVDGMTMRVSSLPTLGKGERAVFFLTAGRAGEFRPHLRGQGILKLDGNNRVPGSSLTLDQIRQSAHAAVKAQ